jgi:hypothetical protein
MPFAQSIIDRQPIRESPDTSPRPHFCSKAPVNADDPLTMPMLVILGIGGALCGWSLLLILSGERQRRLAESPPAAPPVTQNKKN